MYYDTTIQKNQVDELYPRRKRKAVFQRTDAVCTHACRFIWVIRTMCEKLLTEKASDQRYLVLREKARGILNCQSVAFV